MEGICVNWRLNLEKFVRFWGIRVRASLEVGDNLVRVVVYW